MNSQQVNICKKFDHTGNLQPTCICLRIFLVAKTDDVMHVFFFLHVHVHAGLLNISNMSVSRMF